MSREIADYRNDMEPLKIENLEIPDLKARISSLEKLVLERHRTESVMERLGSSQTPGEESNRLSEALSRQKLIEAHLCQQLVQIRTTSSQNENLCKRVISACCNVSLANVEELLQPLLDAVESDSFDSGLLLVSKHISEIRKDNTLEALPTVDLILE